MKNGDIVTVVTLSGEYVGKLSEDTGSTIVMESPRMLIQTETGMGFAAGICVTGARDPKEVTFQQYVFMTPTNEDIENAWRQAVTGIATAPANSKIIT